MSQLNPMIFGIVLVAIFLIFGVPTSKQEAVGAMKGGAVAILIASVLNALFQPKDPSPLNLLWLSQRAGIMEMIMFSGGIAFLSRGLVGAAWLGLKGLNRDAPRK
jgi:hypothetical protein